TQCDLIVNGHRKMGSEVIVGGSVPILQFNFQGKALAVAELEIGKKKTEIVNGFWIPVDNNVPDDTALAVKFNASQTRVKPVYDLYIMSMCPYGLEALAGFMEFVESFKGIEWNLWFIGDVDKDTVFSSLHGTAEIKEEMVWCAVRELYPEIWHEFLKTRASNHGTLESILKGLNADLGKIESWIKANGKKTLHAHYLRSMRQKIEASPTLLVNNYPFPEKISKSRLGKIHCNMSSDQSGYCDSVPECFSHSDCKKSGKIGQCLGNGNCEFRDALPFEFIAVVADSAIQKLHDEVVATTLDLFPGAKVEIVSYGSPRGLELVKKFNPTGLPLYLFGKDVQHAHNFTSIESGLVLEGEYFTFNSGILPQNYYHKREFIKGDLAIFVDPFFAKVDEILGPVVNDTLIGSRAKIYPVFESEGENVPWGTLEMFRCGESMRWLLLGKDRNVFLKYLREYIKLKSHFSWFTNIKESGVDVDSFVNVMKADSVILKGHRKFLDELEVSGPATVLIDNRELVMIRNGFELKKVLGKIRK
ncbi:MAG: hypothetical protein Q4F84_05305, partial [Fibrobacter sp.]|nr:hypothetical protein [Fibrobacter sp.]